jgi:putative nucleotidyltransferase with HDIG domain
VEDDPKVQEILQSALGKRGYRVRVAEGMNRAAQLWEEEAPDLVLLDRMLPDGDGLELLRRIREQEERREVPVILISADGDEERRLGALEAGAVDYLVKPFSLKELERKVERAVNAHRVQKELEEKQSLLEADLSREHARYVRAHRNLKKQVLSMQTLFSITQELNRSLDFEEMVNLFSLTIVGELMVSSMALFAFRHQKSERFELLAIKGLPRERFGDLTIDAKSAFVQWLAQSGKPRKIVRTRERQWVRKLPDIRLAVFEYATPIVVRGEVRGVVFTGPKLNGRGYSAFDLDMLTFVCNSAGIGLENARLFTQLQNTYLGTIKTLVSIIEAKDAYTKGHTERVAAYATAIAREMNLPKEERRKIAFGAVLHDIGKLGVYEGVLNKPGKLNEKEWKLLRSHPEVGAQILRNMEFLSGTVALVRHHHERFDGKGYPDGLAGEDIPLGARIIAVADSFDAMTTNRSYRRALSWERALEILEEKAGTQFDPRVVAAFVSLVRPGVFTPPTAEPEKVSTP